MKKIILPEELKELEELRQWVIHKNKVPFIPYVSSEINASPPASPVIIGACRVLITPAKSNAPETWGSFQEAQEALQTGQFDGLGFQFGNFPPESLRVSGIDLDHVINENGDIEPFAEEIVNLMNSYTEYSPSGKGLHILCKTVLNDIGRKKGINDTCSIEMYNHGRYFTITGKIYGKPRKIEERTSEFKEVYDKYFEDHNQEEKSRVEISILSMSDRELLEKMFNSKHGYEIEKLFNGDFSGYPSQSEADLALISHLIFWTQRDLVRTDNLFRQSGLMRSKWDRADYRNRTLDVALRGQFNLYDPNFYLSARETQNNNILPLSETKGQDIEYYLDNEFNAEMENFEKYKNMKTGFSNLDKITNLYPGLYVLGAISSLGKTTFACQLADQLAKAGEHVLFFSLEQSKFELVTKGLSRITAQESIKNNTLNSFSNTAVSAIKIREGLKTPAVLRAIEEYKSFGKHNIIYQCGFEANINTILDRVNNYIEDNEVKPVVIVDYLQIVRPLDSRISTKDGVDSNVRALKKLQVDNDLVVLLISSLNRSNYLTPVDFEAFKESGGIEYTADVIWGLQLSIMNDEIFDKDKGLKPKRDAVREAKKATPREIELICLKNRYGISSYVCKFDYYAQYDYFVSKNENSSKMNNSKSPVRY